MPARDRKRPRRADPLPDEGAELRIIGGRYRGTKLTYTPHLQSGRHADEGPEALVTRPMKHRVREAIFNLVGVEAEGKHALDLFAGTGALGLEALSRGAALATLIERHVPTSRVIAENVRRMGVEGVTKTLVTSAFLWALRDLPRGDLEGADPAAAPLPWLVFVSPPYEFFVEREAEMRELIAALVAHAPPDSVLVVEADERFDFASLDEGIKTMREGGWDVRTYPPAVVGVWRN